MTTYYSYSNNHLPYPRQAATDLRTKVKEDIYQRLFMGNHNDSIYTELKLDKIRLEKKLEDQYQLEQEMTNLLNDKTQMIKDTSAIQSHLYNNPYGVQSRLEDLKRQNADLKDDYLTLEKEYMDLRANKEEIQKRIEDRNHKIHSLKKRIDDINSQVSNDNEDKYTLIQAKISYPKDKTEAKIQKKRLFEENKRLSYECKVKNEILKKSERLKHSINQELESVNNQISNYSLEINEKTSELEKINNLNSQLEIQLKNIEGELNCLSIETRTIKEQFQKEKSKDTVEKTKREQKEHQILDLEKQVNVLICQLNHEHDYKNILTEDIQRFQLENDKMRRCIATLEKNNDQFNKEIKDANLESYIDDQKSLGLTDLCSVNKSFLNETIRTLNNPNAKPNSYEITVHNLRKGE